MEVIRAHNVEHAWEQAKELLQIVGIESTSRNGSVLVSPLPVSTLYLNPTYRVLRDPVRDANPFFHLMEALWMLAGRNDVAWISQFNARMGEYSDDGVTFHGAYGYRWRNFFDLEGGAGEGFTDQLAKAVACLRADPTSRRVVVQMWDPRADLWSPQDTEHRGVPKDLPCNTAIYFDCRMGRLNMTVTNRSNDIVWGCYGANVVHMSILQEYVAAMIDRPIGWYCQMSHNWHAYTEVFRKQDFQTQLRLGQSIYTAQDVKPLVTDRETFLDELESFIAGEDMAGASNTFLSEVAVPMRRAWEAYKQKDLVSAISIVRSMPDCDWAGACHEWLNRRYYKK